MSELKPSRKYHRLRDYDYASAGLYFVTFCTYGKKCFLSRIEIAGEHAEVILGVTGKILEEELRITESKRPEVVIIDAVIMPNHVHLIIQLSGTLQQGFATNSRSRCQGRSGLSSVRSNHGSRQG